MRSMANQRSLIASEQRSLEPLLLYGACLMDYFGTSVTFAIAASGDESW
jgi:hypothetical protein